MWRSVEGRARATISTGPPHALQVSGGGPAYRAPQDQRPEGTPLKERQRRADQPVRSSTMKQHGFPSSDRGDGTADRRRRVPGVGPALRGVPTRSIASRGRPPPARVAARVDIAAP